jgi:hypothetical protein
VSYFLAIGNLVGYLAHKFVNLGLQDWGQDRKNTCNFNGWLSNCYNLCNLAKKFFTKLRNNLVSTITAVEVKTIPYSVTTEHLKKDGKSCKDTKLY